MQLGASKLVLVVRQLVPMAYKHDVLVSITTSLTNLYTFVVGIARPAKVCEEVLTEWLAFGCNRNRWSGECGCEQCHIVLRLSPKHLDNLCFGIFKVFAFIVYIPFKQLRVVRIKVSFQEQLIILV